MRIHAIVLAGGNGHRFGAEIPKQFVRLAGDPILLRGIWAVAAAGVDQVVVVSHPAWMEETSALVRHALKTLIELEASRRLARLGGTEPDLRPIPRRRSKLR